MAQDIAQALHSKDIKSKISRLCANLDSKSLKCVGMILARLSLSYMLKDKKIYHLSKKEKRTLRAIKREFYPNIITLSKGVYCYNGFFLPINHFEVSVFWYKHGLANFKCWERVCKKNIIDVGAFIGDSAIVLQQYTNQKVYSFEAMSENYHLMCQTLKLNNTDKVIPIKKALGAKFEKVKLYSYGAGSSAVFHKDNNFEEVEVITLDAFVKEHHLEVGFIKVDIEGFEMPFLQGALQTIKTQKPAMCISIYHQASDFFGIKPFLEDLDLGYVFSVYKPIDGSVSGETVLFCEIRE